MKQIVLKFVKAFVTGGFVAISSALALGVQAKNLDDLKGIVIVLGFAFLSGAVHAVVEILQPTLPATTNSVTTTTTQN